MGSPAPFTTVAEPIEAAGAMYTLSQARAMSAPADAALTSTKATVGKGQRSRAVRMESAASRAPPKVLSFTTSMSAPASEAWRCAGEKWRAARLSISLSIGTTNTLACAASVARRMKRKRKRRKSFIM